MKFGILREKESTRQKSCFHRWIATKERYEDAFIQVESSDIRIFTDAQYSDLGIEVSDDISDCDFIWVKEVPVDF
jgi:hypothetical protein